MCYAVGLQATISGKEEYVYYDIFVEDEDEAVSRALSKCNRDHPNSNPELYEVFETDA